MSYVEFDPSKVQVERYTPAKVAKVAKVEGKFSNFSNFSRETPSKSSFFPPLVAAGTRYCPGCKSEALASSDDQTTCLACRAWWIPSIDLSTDAPTATIRIKHPAGHTVTIGIYRCPQCHETRWGPRLDNPAVWCCLTCVNQEAV